MLDSYRFVLWWSPASTVEVDLQGTGGVGHHELEGADPLAAVGGEVALPAPALVRPPFQRQRGR